MRYVSHNTDETLGIAREVAERVMTKMDGRTQAMVLALIGDLGSGKTAFAQSFAKSLGIAEKLKSPTFTLMHRYLIPSSELSLWHLDCYRLEHDKDLANLDLASVFSDRRNIVLIEWPERALTIFPEEHVEIRFTHEGDTKRGITVKWPPSLR